MANHGIIPTIRIVVCSHRNLTANVTVVHLIGDAMLNLFRAKTNKGTTLEVGDKKCFIVKSNRRRNNTKVDLVAGGVYRFSISPGQTWTDGKIPCDAKGWRLGENKNGVKGVQRGKLVSKVIRATQKHRVCSEANWFELVGEAGKWRGAKAFRIGAEKPGDYESEINSRLYTCANDFKWGPLHMYWNNKGEIKVKVERIR